MIVVHQDLAAASAALAARVAEEAAGAIAARGSFRLALSGGSTPRTLYRLLASVPWRGRIAWPKVELLFADERAVPPDAPESNYALVRDTLVLPLGLAEAQVKRMHGEATDLDAAARGYEHELERPIDLVLLGMGADGHVASLFPGGEAVEEMMRRVAVVTDSPRPPARRLTITPPVLREARAVAVLCAGAEKARAVERALREEPPPAECPAALVAGGDWYLDRQAAARLEEA